MTTPSWVPSPERVARSRMDAFRRLVNERHGAGLAAPGPALLAWSVDHLEACWEAVWDACGVAGHRGDVTLDRAGGAMAEARFFPEARLSYAENALAGPPEPSDAAIVFHREDGQRRTLTWDQLRLAVAAFAAALREAGVGPGDRVAAWMPNLPETVVAFLAANAIGAVFSSTSADFGTAGVLDRFGQIAPSVLVAADGYLYGGARFDCLGRLREIAEGLPSLRLVVVVGNLADQPDLSGVPGAHSFADVTAPHGQAPLTFERLPFDQPAYVLYSSGTTGAPKCIVHRAGGVLLKHLSEHQLHCDVHAGDRVLYFTTCGWMMWNWLVSALASKATIVLLDGSPFHPGPATLFDLVDRSEVTLLGVSAKFIDSARKAGLRPADTHRLTSLRTICSTGSPLSAEGFDWVYGSVKADVHLASISGGTDICGCFVAGDPTRPVWRGEIQGPALGMAVDVWDEVGQPLATGQGELVCTQPFPSLPLGFWDDPAGAAYRRAYYERFPGVWAHGDYASWTEHGGMVIHGRSDATLNAAGVRIGTAEIYRQVEQLPEVAEAVAVAQSWEGDTRIVLFVRLADGAVLDDELQGRIRRRLREQCSPRHVPARIAAVTDIPRTRSGKLTELAVADVVHGRPVRSTEALANPEALEQFRDRPELAT